MTKEEIWKDIKTIPYHQPEWPFHQVSNMGRVRVLPGGMIRNRLVTETELRILNLSRGYMSVERWDSYIRCRTGVHILVLNQFFGPCPPGQECRHLNGNRTDNRWPENLAWGTYQENEGDKVLHGTDNRGEHHGMCKLTESEVIDIITRPKYHGVVAALAVEYGVTHTAISQIRRGKRWKYVSSPRTT